MDVIPAPVLVFAGLAAVGGLVYTQCSKPAQRTAPKAVELDLDELEPENKKSKKGKKASGPAQPEKKPVKVVAKKDDSEDSDARKAKKEKKAAAAAAEEARRAAQIAKAKEAKEAAEAKRVAEAEKAAAAKKAEEAKKAAEAKKQAKAAPAKTKEQLEIEKLRAELAAMKAASSPAAPAPAATGKKGKAAAAAAAAPAPAAAVADSGLSLTTAEIEAQQAELANFENDGWQVVVAPRRKKKAAASPEADSPSAPKVPEGPAKITVDVKVAATERGVVLGRGGETLKRITELTGADVKVPKSEAPNDPVQITGTAEQVAEAKQAILELVKRGFSTLLDPSMAEVKVKVPANRRVAVLGTKGANVKKIQDATGVRVNFPDRTSTSEFVQVVGDKEACLIAKTAIESLVADGYSAITHEDFIKIEVEFPSKYRNKLIGVKGEYIKSLEYNTKCRFSFPEGDADLVVIVGPAGNIAQAERAVRRLQEKLDTPVVEVAADGFDEEEYEDDEAW